MIFDTHAHYDDHRFDEDREALLTGLQTENVDRIVNVGSTLESCPAVMELVERYPFMYGAVGIHPEDIPKLTDAYIEKLRAWADHPKIVAIGEIGLDYHYEGYDKALQAKWFTRQMELAREVNLPIIVHSRDAAKDTIDLMQAAHAEDIGGVIHCYSYSKEVAGTFLAMGFYFGIGGVLTYKNGKKLKEVVEWLPLDRIITETDCPYLTPEPVRKYRNNSAYITYVLDVIAELKGMERTEVEQICYDNAMRMYRLS